MEVGPVEEAGVPNTLFEKGTTVERPHTQSHGAKGLTTPTVYASRAAKGELTQKFQRGVPYILKRIPSSFH